MVSEKLKAEGPYRHARDTLWLLDPSFREHFPKGFLVVNQDLVIMESGLHFLVTRSGPAPVVIGSKTFTERLMGHAVELEAAVWRQLNTLWVVNFAAIGALNLYVMYNFNLQIWVYFKTWGMIGLSVLMAVGQAIWISSRATDRSADGGSSN